MPLVLTWNPGVAWHDAGGDYDIIKAVDRPRIRHHAQAQFNARGPHACPIPVHEPAELFLARYRARHVQLTADPAIPLEQCH